jgi:hypothetical protein
MPSSAGYKDLNALAQKFMEVTPSSVDKNVALDESIAMHMIPSKSVHS